MNTSYMKAVVCTFDRKKIYARDLRVNNVFDQFVSMLVSDLITTGTLFEGEHFKVLVIPCYDVYKMRPPIISHDLTKIMKHSLPFSLEIEEDIKPDEPITYFTIMIGVPLRSFCYRADFQTYQLTFFWLTIKKILYAMNILRPGEICDTELYVRNDDAAIFDRNFFPSLEATKDSLVEVVRKKNIKDSFIRKAITDFTLQSVHRIQYGKTVEQMLGEDGGIQALPDAEVQVILERTVLESVQQIALADVHVEQGGVLVGQVYKDSSSSGYIVLVTDHIMAEGAIASEIELRYTFETWQHRSALLKEQYHGKRIIGWYHTHLVKIYAPLGELPHISSPTALFFSADDHFTHGQFFRDKWYIAMVLDTEGNTIFFHWKNQDIVAAEHFFIGTAGKEA